MKIQKLFFAVFMLLATLSITSFPLILNAQEESEDKITEEQGEEDVKEENSGPSSVSYTHLTLPTILLV